MRRWRGTAHPGPGSPAAGSGQVTGFSILQAESADARISVLDGHPHLQMMGGAIEVLECAHARHVTGHAG